MQKIEMNCRNSQKKQSSRSVPPKIIDFCDKPAQLQVFHTFSKNGSKQSIEPTELNQKINKTLKQSMISPYKKSSKAMNEESYEQKQESIKQNTKQEIFSIPKIIKNITRLIQNPERQHDLSSNRKLFGQKTQYFQKLKSNTKVKTSNRTSVNSLNQETSIKQNKGSPEKQIIISTWEKNRNSSLNQQYPLSNRSKTMNFESSIQKQKPQYYRKTSLLSKQKSYYKDDSQNLIKFYQKFEKYFKLVQREQSKLKNKDLIPVNFMNNKGGSDKKSTPKNVNRKSKIQIKQRKPRQIDIQNPEPQVCQVKSKQISTSSQTQLKIMVKSNSNNKGFKQIRFNQAAKEISKKSHKSSQQPQNYEKQTIKFINLTSNRIQSEDKAKNANFSWKGERIHNHETQKKAELVKYDSKKNARKTRYFHYERNMKISNNMHIVITENNKTKINIFHNSLLLKEDPDKINALTSLVRDVSRQVTTQKIQVPPELGINKLNIHEKGPNSGRDSRRQIQQKLEDIQKKAKQKRKQRVPTTRTQKIYHLRLEDVKPWQIMDQKQSQQSQQKLFDQNEYDLEQSNYNYGEKDAYFKQNLFHLSKTIF